MPLLLKANSVAFRERRRKLELELHYENCILIPGTWCNTQSNAQGLNIVRITARTTVKVIKLQNFLPTGLRGGPKMGISVIIETGSE